MADRLRRRGVPHPEACPLCDQCDETIDHLLLGCVLAREIWFHVLRWAGLERLAETGGKIVGADTRKGTNSLMIFTAWFLWKYRNRVVFDNETPTAHATLIREIKDEALRWVSARAKWLGRLIR